MLSWPIAAKEPSAIEAIEMNTTICCQSTAIGSKAPIVTRTISAIAAIFGAAAWIVRGDPLLFGVAMVALAGAQVTSYVRAKAESLGWDATVGIIERPERVMIIITAIGLGFLEVALWVLAVGSVVTIGQRLAAVLRQVGEEP